MDIDNEAAREHFPVDLVDIGFAWAFGANPSTLLALAVIGQYTIRHSDSVRGALLDTAQKALPLLAKALPLKDNRNGYGKPPCPSCALPTKGKTPALPAVTIERIAKGDNILLVGNKGSGKSTLLATLVTLREGTTVVLDPHYAPGAWAHASRVVGAGRDYANIATFFGDLEKSLSVRYREMATGKRQWQQLTVCGDEWRSIAQKVDGAGGVFTSVITEGRKVRLCVLAASHNDTVAALGCKGDKDSFLNSFDWIIYTGAFATDRFPSSMEIPSIPTPHGDIPALACAVSVNEQKDYVLDLRTVTAVNSVATSTDDAHSQTTSETPSNRQDDASLLASLLMPVWGYAKPQTEQTDKPVYPVSNWFETGLATTEQTTEQTGIDGIKRTAEGMLARGKSKKDVAAWLSEQDEIIAHIATLLSNGTSVNAVCTWLGETFGIKDKTTARSVVASVQAKPGNDLLDGYLGDRTE
jgi:energy-coupling factor transporter ATP-binding protein EcfA2